MRKIIEKALPRLMRFAFVAAMFATPMVIVNEPGCLVIAGTAIVVTASQSVEASQSSHAAEVATSLSSAR